MTGELPTLQALATEARAVNAANGWGLTFKREDLPNYIALLHSEVTEVWTALTPEEEAHELGDVIVRALDLAEMLSPGALEGVWLTTPYNGGPTLERALLPAVFNPHDIRPATALLVLHSHISRALENYRKVKDEALMLALVLENLCDVIAYARAVMTVRLPDCTPTLIVQGIIEKNRSRGYRHGGRRT